MTVKKCSDVMILIVLLMNSTPLIRGEEYDRGRQLYLYRKIKINV